MSLPAFALIVPTLNPGFRWSAWLNAVNSQTIQPARLLVVDSSSDDGQIKPSGPKPFELITIARETFNHGTTRQRAFQLVRKEVEAVIFMTQDAILADNHALQNLISGLSDPTVAAVYGRQLPHPETDHFGAHARKFNYGPDSAVRKLVDRDTLGLRTCFISNSFAAYRCHDLDTIGGFPESHFGEDMLVAARLLMSGRQIGYVAEARVYHSHDFSMREEFARYYAVGQLHAQHPWLLREFGGPTGEGRRFVRSEARYLIKRAPYLLPAAICRTLAKFLGYQLGSHSCHNSPDVHDGKCSAP